MICTTIMPVAIKNLSSQAHDIQKVQDEPTARVVPTVFGCIVLKSGHAGRFHSGLDGQPFLYESDVKDGPLFLITHGPQDNVKQTLAGLTLEQVGDEIIGRLGSKLIFKADLNFIGAMGHDAQDLVRVFRSMLRHSPH